MPPTSSNFPTTIAVVVDVGIAPQIAALEALANPTTAELLAVDSDARGGTLEILPPEAPLVVFVWGSNRVVPVRVTEFSVTEEAFDPVLNPICAPRSASVCACSRSTISATHIAAAPCSFPTCARARRSHNACQAQRSQRSASPTCHEVCMNDPVQMLIDAGAIPATPFGPSSRYGKVAIGRYQVSSEESVPYVLRRFVPQVRDIPLVTYHLVRAGDRLDVIAGHYLGDAELHWRVADANRATDMLELTATAGLRIAIPTPPGTGS